MTDRELIEKTKYLSPEDIEKVLELWFKAAQGNKDETSGLHSELRKMIKDLDTKVEAFIKRSEPFIKTAENMKWLKGLFISFILTLGAVVTAVAVSSNYVVKAIHHFFPK